MSKIKNITILSTVLCALLCWFVACNNTSQMPVQANSETDDQGYFCPDSFATRPLPDNLRHARDANDLYSSLRGVSPRLLFLYGLSRSPVGNVMTDHCNTSLTRDDRLLLLRLLACKRGADLPFPTRGELERLFVSDTVDIMTDRGDAESMTAPTTEQKAVRRLVFDPVSGPSYVYELNLPEALDENSTISGYDWFYLHRSGGNHNGSVLSWTTASTGFVRTTGVSVPKYGNPLKIKYTTAFEYEGLDASSRRVSHPIAFRADSSVNFCSYLDDDTCTAVSVYHAATPTSVGQPASGHGYVWRAGCYSDNGCGENYLDCFISSGPQISTDNHNGTTFACPYVHIYYGSTPTYTGYNDGRWRVDATIYENQHSSKVEVLVNSQDWDLFNNTTLYVLCKPYFRAWIRGDAPGDNYNWAAWYQMFQGHLTDANWSTSVDDSRVWRGADNYIPFNHAQYVGTGCDIASGCGADQTTALRWAPAYIGSSSYPFPYKGMSAYDAAPWADAGYLDCGVKLFTYGFGDLCGTTDAYSDHEFGQMDFTNNTYTTFLEVLYEEIGIE